MADLIYFLSQSIEVYPSGFRGQGYPQSKLTTEENITRLQSYLDLADGIYEDARDTDYYILKISGYTFKFSKQSLIKALPQTPNPSENIYRVFAGIKLRDGGTNIGQVLAPLNSTLSSDIVLDKDDHFQGLGLEITTNSEPTSTQFDFYTEIGLWVKSVVEYITKRGTEVKTINGYAFAANGNIDDYMGTPLRYRVEQTSLHNSPFNTFNISILGAVAEVTDVTFTKLQIPKKVIFNSTSEIEGNLKYIPHSFTVDEIQTIRSSAFEGYSNLTSITIPEGITSIGEYAFNGCSNLISLTIPDSVTSIGKSAFYNCSSLKSITIGNSVTSIGKWAFYRCTTLTEINYNATECADLSTSNYVFAYAGQSGTGITVTIGANVKKLPAFLFYPEIDIIYAPKITSVNFEEGSVCESIGAGAFRNCSSLATIIIPDSVTTIGTAAFKDCAKLKNITIPDNITSIQQDAFSGCLIENATIPTSAISAIENSSLKTVTLTSGESIPDSAFYNCSSLTSVTIPNSVMKINSGAFANCIELTNIIIPNSVKSIDDYAFQDCESLTSITIPDSVTSIGNYAFYTCSSVTNITIPDSVTSIGDYAFYDCKSLTNIVLPNNLESIGDYAFGLSSALSGSSSISQIIIPEKVTEIGSNAFKGRIEITKIIVHNYMNSITGAPWGASNAKVLWLMMNDDLKLYVPETVLDEGSYEIYYRYINDYMFSIQDIYLGKLEIFPKNFKINNKTILGRVIKSVLEPTDASGKVVLSTYMCGVSDANDGNSSGTLHLWKLDSTINEVTLQSTSDNYPQIWYKRIY